MRQLAVIALLIAAPAAAHDFSTVDEYQADFAAAKECKPIDGRRLWVGKQGYYIQSWLFYTGQSGELDPENAGAVPYSDNAASELTDFAAACK